MARVSARVRIRARVRVRMRVMFRVRNLGWPWGRVDCKPISLVY